MDKKGFWAMLLSTAQKWTSIFSPVHKYMFRYHQAANDRIEPSAGSDNDDLPEKNGRAVINTIYGNTVKWNQLIRNGDFSNGTTSWYIRQAGSLTVSNGIASYYKKSTSSINTISQYCKITQNHVYVIIADVTEFNTTAGLRFTIGSSTNLIAPNQQFNYTYNSGKYISILKATENYNYIGFNGPWSDLNVDDLVFKLTNVQLFDLTEIFGEGNEPSTTDEFEAWLALNVGTQDYYPYDEGSLISFGGTALKSVGFNQWDGTYLENRRIRAIDGTLSSTTNINVTDYIRVLANTNYYLNTTRFGSNTFGCAWYDADKHFISGVAYSGDITSKVGVVLSPTNATYLRASFKQADITTFCINLSDVSRNGTYEPYWSDEKPFDVTKVYGKLNGAGNYVQVFTDGMNKVTNADEINENNAKVYNKRNSLVGIDLTRHSQDNCWSTTSATTKTGAIVLSDKYVSVPPQNNVAGLRTYCLNNGISKGICSSSAQPNRVYVYDDSVSTDEELNQANANEYIIYDITPRTYTNLIYRDNSIDTPLEEVFPIKYKVDKYSTEELLVPASEAGEPTSTAIIADIDYQKKG